MAAAAELKVRIADLPQVKQALAQAAEKIETLRSLLAAWEPRVRCTQCGQRYSGTPCGPTHAIVWFHVHGGEPPVSDEDKIRDAMTEAQDHPGRIVTR